MIASSERRGSDTAKPDLKKTEFIRNPLTLIATFAGISEVAMTAALPFLPSEIQKTFMWFVMVYPTFLVICFFYILIWKREVLYAPSDFKDDETWLKVYRDKQLQILEKYPLEPAIASPSEKTTHEKLGGVKEPSLKRRLSAGLELGELAPLLEENNFYKFLKALGLTPPVIKKIISSAGHADDLSDIALEQTSKEIAEKIKIVFNEFPTSKTDFYELKSRLEEFNK